MAESILNLNVSNEPDQSQHMASTEEDDLRNQSKTEQSGGKVSYVGKPGFQRQYDDCTKNPNHEGFTSERDFIRLGPSCVPDGYKDEPTFNFIKSQATLTVKLIVGFISEDRPKGYPLADWRGRRNLSFPVTGMVVGVKSLTVEDGQLFSCSACKSCSTVCNCKELFTLEVRTARYGVFDQKEANQTTLSLSYFTGENETMIQLSHGIHTLISSDSDQSALSFTTHDKHLCNKLKEALRTMHSLMDCVIPLFNSDKDKVFLPIVSYPHGCDKQVSFGFIEKCSGKEIPNGVRYNTPTCPGSGGAAIFYGMDSDSDVNKALLYYHHEGCDKSTGMNVSGSTSFSIFEDPFAEQG